jgi:hypothetical protein
MAMTGPDTRDDAVPPRAVADGAFDLLTVLHRLGSARGSASCSAPADCRARPSTACMHSRSASPSYRSASGALRCGAIGLSIHTSSRSFARPR